MATETSPARTAANLVNDLASELLANGCTVTERAIEIARELRTPAKSLPAGARSAAATLGIQVRFASVGDLMVHSNITHEAGIVYQLAGRAA